MDGERGTVGSDRTTGLGRSTSGCPPRLQTRSSPAGAGGEGAEGPDTPRHRPGLVPPLPLTTGGRCDWGRTEDKHFAPPPLGEDFRPHPKPLLSGRRTVRKGSPGRERWGRRPGRLWSGGWGRFRSSVVGPPSGHLFLDLLSGVGHPRASKEDSRVQVHTKLTDLSGLKCLDSPCLTPSPGTLAGRSAQATSGSEVYRHWGRRRPGPTSA